MESRGLSISFPVAFDLRCPKRPIRSGNMAALGAPVPETPVNENRQARLREHEIGTASEALGPNLPASYTGAD